MIEVILYCIVSYGGIVFETPYCVNAFELKYIVRQEPKEPIVIKTITHEVSGV